MQFGAQARQRISGPPHKGRTGNKKPRLTRRGFSLLGLQIFINVLAPKHPHDFDHTAIDSIVNTIHSTDTTTITFLNILNRRVETRCLCDTLKTPVSYTHLTLPTKA